MKEHERIHMSEKSFPCTFCGECFTIKENLVQHEKVHVDEKPVCCNDCGKCFGKMRGLIQHRRNRDGGKPFSCSECGKLFNGKSCLLEHVKIHADEKPEALKDFWKNFPAKLLKAHVDDTSHSCSECGANLELSNCDCQVKRQGQISPSEHFSENLLGFTHDKYQRQIASGKRSSSSGGGDGNDDKNTAPSSSRESPQGLPVEGEVVIYEAPF